MTTAFRQRVRRFAFASTRLPGVSRLMRGMYRGIAWGVAALLKREPAVITLYLRRGCAKGEDIPGISDIDIGVVIPEENADAERLQKRFRRIQRFLPILDPSLEAYTEASLATSERYCMVMRFRLEEGRNSYVRLHGPPRVEEMPPLNPALWPDALLSESAILWALFTEHLLSGEAQLSDPFQETAQCVKSISESLRIRATLETGTLPDTRRAALVWAEKHADSSVAECAREALALLNRRFDNPSPGLNDRALAFLLRHGDWVHEIFARFDRSTDLRHLPQSVDDDPAERSSSLNQVQGYPFRASAYWAVGERLYILPDASGPLTIAFLRSQIAEARRTLGPGSSLFFRYNDLLFQVGEPRVLYRRRSILHPLFSPEAFAPEVPMSEARWTMRSEVEFIQWRAQYYNHTENEVAEERLTPADVAQWDTHLVKAVQLEAIRRSALRGQVVYPLTRPATARAAEREGIAIPGELRPLFSPDEAEVAAAVTALGKSYRVNPELLRL